MSRLRRQQSDDALRGGTVRSREGARRLAQGSHGPAGRNEAMKVYRNWQRADRGLDPYRAAVRKRYIIITTDHANP